jgi:hypothetical protein
MKKISLLLGISLTLFFSCENLFDGKPQSPSLFDFIRNNPDRASFIMTANDTLLLNLNSDAPTMVGNNTHLIIALEYARQMSEKVISDEDTMVAINDLEVFNIHQVIDPGHLKWKNYIEYKNLVTQGKVCLEEVVKGMLKYKSMAITEYLGEKLGILNINSMKSVMGLKTGKPLYPFPVSSCLLFSTYPGDPGINFPNRTAAVSEDDYLKECSIIHEGLKQDRSGILKKKFQSSPPRINEKLLETWEPTGTAREYHTLISRISRTNGLDPGLKKRFVRVMEWSLPDHKVNYTNVGRELGITSDDIAGIMYATDVKGYRTEIVCFLNDLSVEERNLFGSMMDGFLMNCTLRSNRENILDKLKTK